MPSFWFGTGNDNLGDGVLDRDDFRTGELDVGASRGHWAGALDASVLTNRATGGGSPGRTDQVTGSIGYLLEDGDGRRAPAWRLIAGGGARSLGDLGGARVQQGLHRNAGYPSVDLPYDRERATDPLVFACGHFAKTWATPDAASFVAPRADWGFAASAAGLATAGGEREGELELDLLYAGAEGSTWLGARERVDVGTLVSPTAVVVADHEHGLWLVSGASIVPAASPFGAWLTTGINPRSRAAVGAVGISWRRVPQRGGSFPVEQDIGYYSGAVIGFQYRWQPSAMHEAMPEWLRNEVLIDYRFGGAPNYAWRDVKILSDQALIGHGLTLVPQPLFGVVSVMPYGYGGLGIRIERVQRTPEPGGSPRFADQSAARGVAQMGGGLRLAPHVGAAHPRVAVLDRLRFGVGYDRWFPWHQAPVANGADHDRYQQVNWSLGGYVGVLMVW